MKRNDIHRPSVLDPTEYVHLLSFSYPGPMGDPGFAMIELSGLRHSKKFFIKEEGFGCDVCGANFLHGDVFEHAPTATCIVVGHICADKMSLLADRREWEDYRKRSLQARKQGLRRRKMRKAMRAQLSTDRDLGKALKTDHHISRDLRSNFIKWGSLSEAQVALAKRLVGQVAEQNAKKAEEDARKVDAPVSDQRIDVEGTVVTTKYQSSQFGETLKMLLVVDTADGGVWKAWGSVPTALTEIKDDDGQYKQVKGMRVIIRARFERSKDDASFAFFKRPSLRKVIEVK